MERLLVTETTSVAGQFRIAALNTLSSAVLFSSKKVSTERSTQSVPETIAGSQNLTGLPGEGKTWHLILPVKIVNPKEKSQAFCEDKSNSYFKIL